MLSGMTRAPLTALLAAVALALVGCGDGPPPRQAAPAPSPVSVSPSASASGAPSAAPSGDPQTLRVDPATTGFFASPSRNIACSMSASGAVCEIGEHSFEPPPKPADCELDHGTMLAVEGGARAEFLCHGDTAFTEDATVVQYGSRITNGLFTCSSSESGMACASASGAHGFELARARYRLY